MSDSEFDRSSTSQIEQSRTRIHHWPSLGISVLAIIFAVAALIVSVLAFTHDNGGSASSAATQSPVSHASSPSAGTSSDPTSAGGDSPVTDPDSSPSVTPSILDPGASFTAAYQDKRLTIRSTSCSTSDAGTPVDLGSGVVNSADGSTDIEFSGCNPGQISTKLPYAEISSSTSTPKDCLTQIQTSPLVNPVAPAKGLNLCFVTDKAAAATSGSTQKIVTLSTLSVGSDGNGGTLTVVVSAWNVPN